MSAPRIPKTNAARLLETLGIPFELHTADVDESDLSAVTLARRLGADPACVFKTLVARGDKTGVLMACIPAAAELDLKALAAASGNKHAEMVPLKDVRPLTGYVRGGCSPLGAKKAYPVFVDESAILQDSIYVSAGQRGVQLRLRPDDLLRAVQGSYAALTRT
ncbi:MAG: Cys-tRNA(Pro) deacylase [Desulfovibrio sp.]|uniref:Cys-tRNA(Pro) deacylase n=1 Tax=uncultured Desulfovibrio sp. TaxID=167968 RepID=UPI001B2A9013|nr:Cys-tRNA(Pro) deacylase [uncultured Desulfovibrio sp.]MBO6171439.1 Cys-tRNA(Pro) deacylase [Desulfovibrio sp.]